MPMKSRWLNIILRYIMQSPEGIENNIINIQQSKSEAVSLFHFTVMRNTHIYLTSSKQERKDLFWYHATTNSLILFGEKSLEWWKLHLPYILLGPLCFSSDINFKALLVNVDCNLSISKPISLSSAHLLLMLLSVILL